MKIVCVGDCGVDHYLPSGERFPGGITSNFARQAARLLPATDEIHVLSVTGNDGETARLARSAVSNSVIHCHFDDGEGATAVQYIEIETGGEKNFVRYDEGVLASFRMTAHHEAIISDADLLVAPVFRQVREMFDSVLAAPRSGEIAVDFADFASHPDFDHLEARLPQIDIAFFGLHSGQESLVERLGALARASGRLVVVTLGAGGSIAFAAHQVHRCAALPVPEVIDTTGAGDAYAAGFLAAYVHGSSVPEAMRQGAALAAETVQHLGAVPQLCRESAR